MKTKLATAIALICLGSATSLALAADMDRDRTQDQDRDHTEMMDRSHQGDMAGDKMRDSDRDRLMDRDHMINRDRDMMRDRDQTQDRDQVQDRDRVRDRDETYADGTGRMIYGAGLMTEEERAQYRERLVNAQTEQEREQIRAEHRATIEARAKSRGVDITSVE